MNSNTINWQPQTINSNNNNSLIKLLVFEMGILTLALPIEQVQKVVKHSAIHGSGLSYVNLVHLGSKEVAVVDLHRKLFKVSQPEILDQKGYFIITKSIIGEPLGIMVAQTPSLMDVPLEQIRAVPNSYRQADTLEIASHVAVIPRTEDRSLTIFILDLKQLI